MIRRPGWPSAVRRCDYVGTVEALLGAGAQAPPPTDEVEASEPVRAVLRRHAAGR